jgi:hypothetical protein
MRPIDEQKGETIMKKEVQNEADIDALSDAWDRDAVGKRRIIERIEDLPDLEEVSGAEIEWLIDGIIAPKMLSPGNGLWSASSRRCGIPVEE